MLPQAFFSTRPILKLQMIHSMVNDSVKAIFIYAGERIDFQEETNPLVSTNFKYAFARPLDRLSPVEGTVQKVEEKHDGDGKAGKMILMLRSGRWLMVVRGGLRGSIRFSADDDASPLE